jgi:16S rRNA (cytidine1402-2'-O)-methyltransferase
MDTTLYIVSTPIGNLGDITLRALEILKSVDLVAAEDTRHSRKLFSRYDIKTPLVSYYRAKEEITGDKVLAALQSGKNVALISDAGTPGISDPGYYLIKKTIDEGGKVITIPGPSAIISALTLSGLPTDRFVFEGFLPPKGSARKRRLEAILDEKRTIIFYESPRRAGRTLKELLKLLGDRKAALARELTKIHEEVVRGKISDIIKVIEENGLKGEVTLILAGQNEKVEKNSDEADVVSTLQSILEKGLSVKDSAEIAAREFNISKRRAYQEIIRMKDGRGKK